MQAEAQKRYVSLRDLPAEAMCGSVVALHMNAGLMADLPSLEGSGAEGVGLFRTELQFLVRNKVPKRGELAALYARVMDAAQGQAGRVPHARHRVGQGAALHEARGRAEPGAGLAGDPGGARQARACMRMQLQALIRAAAGRPLTVMFPFVAQMDEYTEARAASGRRDRAGAAARARAAREGRDRGDAGDAEPRLRAAGVLRDDGLPVDRGQRPQAVLLRRRPRERAGAAALRHAERELPALHRADRGPLPGDGDARELLRGGCGAAGGGAVPVRRWDSGRCRCGRRPSGRSSISCAG